MNGIQLRAKEYLRLFEMLSHEAFYKNKLVNKIYWSGENEVTVVFSGEGPGEEVRFNVYTLPKWTEVL